MATYTVQRGDTLSGIGSRHGVDWRKITGYSSGNPNMIRPGEVLTVPDAGASRSPTQPAAQLVTPSPQVFQADEVSQAQSALMDYYNNRENPADIYSRARRDIGLDTQEELVKSIANKILDTNREVEQIDPNVTKRAGNFLMTEGDRQALIANERKPKDEILRELLRSKEREDVNLSGSYSRVNQLMKYYDDAYDQKGKALEASLKFATDRRTYADQLAAATAKAAKGGSSKAETEAKKQQKAYTEQVWYKLMSNNETMKDLELAMQRYVKLYARRGADPNQLWTNFYKLKAKKGSKGYVRNDDF